MRFNFLLSFLCCFAMNSFCQVQPLLVSVTNEKTNEPLEGASISIYKNRSISGTITNREGKFVITDTTGIDSVKISMIGHHTRIIAPFSYYKMARAGISLSLAATNLEEIVVKPLTAIEIIEKAIVASKAALPRVAFENNVFYREVIKDKEQYFSVAEAVFKTQYDTKNKLCLMQMLKGRSKEDVSYTRLFEDYHPGGGPEAVATKYLAVAFPDFLNKSKTGLFVFKKEKPVEYDGNLYYVVSFDQRPGIHEALDKGEIFIAVSDFTVLKYKTENSPLGTPYITDLKGTDKLFAELLHIDFKRKGWNHSVSFEKVNDQLVMRSASAEYRISYKQPKKDLDLDLSITTELVTTIPYLPITAPINKEQEWKRKNLVANLPADFDAGFWGSNNIISPTTQVDSIIKNISIKNQEDTNVTSLKDEWKYLNKDFLAVYQQHDSVVLIPVRKGGWEDDETAGMIYKEVNGDFSIETYVDLSKRTNTSILPDNGFQQAGIIIRSNDDKTENSILLCIGTGGNSQAKIFLRKTDNGKSKGPVDKIEKMSYGLKLIKRGASISAYYKATGTSDWKLITSYQVNWLNDSIQAGFAAMSRFAGSGPKAKPDMKAVFSNFILKND